MHIYHQQLGCIIQPPKGPSAPASCPDPRTARPREEERTDNMNMLPGPADTNLAPRAPAAPPVVAPALPPTDLSPLGSALPLPGALGIAGSLDLGHWLPTPATPTSDLRPLTSKLNAAYSRAHVDRLGIASELVKQLTPIGVILPQHHSQVRALLGLTPTKPPPLGTRRCSRPAAQS